MDHTKTTLERAFEIARSGKTADLTDLRKQLKQEGYVVAQVEGSSIARQLRALMRSAVGSQSERGAGG